MSPALTRAKNAKIPVLLIGTPIDQKELFTAFVGEDSAALGEAAGRAMGEALKSANRLPAKIAAITGSMDEGLAPVRLAGFRRAIEAYPGASIVAVEETHWAPPEAERAAGQLLARFAGQGGLDAIYGMNDALANGAVQGAEAAGITLGSAKGDLIVVGGNCMTPGIKDIEQGKMQATTSMVPTKTGQLAAAAAAAILGDKPFNPYQMEPVDIITKANIQKYRADCSY